MLLQKREHIFKDDPRPEGSWSLAVTTGSQDALGKAFDMLIEDGDTVLVDSPTYSGALAYLRPMGCSLVGIETDHLGLVPHALEKALQASYSRRPRVLYTIVTGQNPSGATMSMERKRRVYELACQYDLIVLEDDPYKYLEYGPSCDKGTWRRPCNVSMFSMDRQGRVLRFDSLSKVLSSGLRLGFVTGPSSFVNQINLCSQAANLHSSGPSQMMAAKLLERWGEAGWNAHCDKVACFYAGRRDVFVRLCQKHLTGLAEWHAPVAGMFVWLRLLRVADSQKLIEDKALQAKVILLHGAAFCPKGEISPYVRASFSTANDADMDTALSRFGQLLRNECTS